MSKRAPRGRPTIVDVAREAGVSAATVSNALNNRRYVKSDTKVRVTAAAARLGYTPNVHARRLRSAGIGAIGLLSSIRSRSRSGLSTRVSHGDRGLHGRACARERLTLLLVPSTAAGTPTLRRARDQRRDRHQPDADDPYVTHLRHRGIPLVRRSAASPARRRRTRQSIFARRETARLLLERFRRYHRDGSR